MGLASLNLMQLAPKSAVLYEITHHDGHGPFNAIQGQPILEPMESLYVTS